MNPKVDILYDDNYFLAVNKPAGMIVNNADTSREMYTLQDWVLEQVERRKLSMEKGIGEFENRAGIVHRLDKETSGVLLIAKNEETFSNLQSQFKNRIVKKIYVALCHGELTDNGNISVPVGRLPWNRKRFGVVPEGRLAITDFKLIGKYENPDNMQEVLSYVRAFPKTGRTHQLRVHFQYSGHPIYADSLYAGRKTSRTDRKRLPRHFLHAEKISFLKPDTHKEITIESNLPDDLESFLKSLRKAS